MKYNLRRGGETISTGQEDPRDLQVGDTIATGIRSYRVVARTDDPDGVITLDVEPA